MLQSHLSFFDEPSERGYPVTKKRGKKAKKNCADKVAYSNHLELKSVIPKTDNQAKVFDAYANGDNVVLNGIAGTGKTFVCFYLALRQILTRNSPYQKLHIIRSVVPSRDIGFLPGKIEDKARVYEAPYYAICSEIFGRDDAYELLKNKGLIEFTTTSFVRGTTFRDCVILFDEFQNTTLHEFSSVVTRVGENCRLMISGDYYQSDLKKDAEKREVQTILAILRKIPSCSIVDFKIEDIVRSKFVKDFIIAKNKVTGD